jgi:hypothetical protein
MVESFLLFLSMYALIVGNAWLWAWFEKKNNAKKT